MQIEVLGGEFSISRKEGKPVLEITVFDKGCFPPEWIKIETTLEEARLVASGILEVQKEVEHALLIEQAKQEPKFQKASAS